MNTTEMPPASMECPWCAGGISVSSTSCPECYMPVNESGKSSIILTEAKKSTPKVGKPKPESKNGESISSDYRTLIKKSKLDGKPVAVGIDPGARYIGFSVRNSDDVFVSSTFMRPDSIPDSVEWAKEVVRRVKEVLKGIEYDAIGIEGVTDPTGFKGGKQDALNPKDIIRTGIVVGALAITYPEASIIRPRGNGDKPEDYYPKSLFGIRPKELAGTRDPGVKVRKHERSAYDVAGAVLFDINQKD